VNKEQRVQHKLLIQTPTFKEILKLVYSSLPTMGRQWTPPASPYALICIISHWTSVKMASLFANLSTDSQTKQPLHGTQFANTQGILTPVWHVWREMAHRLACQVMPMAFSTFPIIGNKLYTTCKATLKVFKDYERVLRAALFVTYSFRMPH
jgi:hypothetical protein